MTHSPLTLQYSSSIVLWGLSPLWHSRSGLPQTYWFLQACRFLACWPVHWLSEIEKDMENAQGRPKRCPTFPVCSPGGQSSLMMRCIDWYSPCKKTTWPRELMARWAQCLNPKKDYSPCFMVAVGWCCSAQIPSFWLCPPSSYSLCLLSSCAAGAQHPK